MIEIAIAAMLSATATTAIFAAFMAFDFRRAEANARIRRRLNAIPGSSSRF